MTIFQLMYNLSVFVVGRLAADSMILRFFLERLIKNPYEIQV